MLITDFPANEQQLITTKLIDADAISSRLRPILPNWARTCDTIYILSPSLFLPFLLTFFFCTFESLDAPESLIRIILI